MKISSEVLEIEGKNIFVILLDTQKTGNQDMDISTASMEFINIDFNDCHSIAENVTQMISDLIYNAYGEKPETYGKKEPLTNYSRTGFDPDYPNGVKV